MKKVKRFLSVLCALSMISVLAAPAYAAGELAIQDSINQHHLDRYAQIQELYQERGRAMLDALANATITRASVDTVKVQEIDQELEALGVREIDFNNLESLPITRSNFEPPVDSANTKWTYTSYSDVYYQGSYYDMFIITASMNSTASDLYESSTLVKTYRPGIGAAICSLLSSAASGAAGLIPGVGTAISVYDAAKDAISSLSTTTIIDNVVANYGWQSYTNLTYAYVQKAGSVDSADPTLSYVYNRAQLNSYAVLHEVNYESEDPNMKFPKAEYNSPYMVKGADGFYNPIDAYLNYYLPAHNFIDEMYVYGANKEIVHTIYAAQHLYPGFLN